MRQVEKSKFLTKLCALAATLLIGSTSFAASFPEKPVRLVVGFAAGGPTDVIARVIAEDLTKTLGQAVIVENRPGGTALVATNAVANAPADGYTLLFSSVQLLINPILSPDKSDYSPFTSFAPISNVASLPMVIISASDSPLNSIQDIIDAAKAEPGAVSFGSSGHGSTPHLAAATLGLLSGTQMLNVPFRGNGPALTEVIAGRVNFMFYPIVGVESQVEAKRLKVLAIGTSEPNASFPGAPTFRQAGYQELEGTAPWVGMLAPAGTPKEVVEKLSSGVQSALSKPEIKERIAALGGVIIGDTPSEYAQFLSRDYEHWKKVVESAGLRNP